MKKTLVAAAVLASLGTAAFAQSSVTLYGRIDASLANVKQDNVGFAAGVDTDVGAQIRSGAHTGSRWGLRGSEDLGGGLKGIFTLEQGFNVDDGSASVAARQFHRQAFVGLDGGFGSLTIGRQYTLTDVNQANYDAFGLSGYSAHGYAFNSNCTVGLPATPGVAAIPAANVGDCGGPGGAGGGRINNSVIYSTPSMGGFGAKLLWSPGEDKGVSSAGQTYGALLSYAAGPLSLGGSWESYKVSGARAKQDYTLGASYDLGAAKLFGMLEGGKNKNFNLKDQGFSIGAVIPLGAPSLMVSYGRENQKLGGAKISRTSAFNLMGQYPLSKRTYVYAAFLKGEYNPTNPALATREDRSYGLGVVHNF